MITQAATDRIMTFLDCWRRFDLDGAVALAAESITFLPDMKAEPVVGRAAVRALWGDYMEKMQSYAVEIRAIGGDESRIFVERVERIGSSRGIELVLPIVGVFEFDATGLLTGWRDYWDTSMADAH